MKNDRHVSNKILNEDETLNRIRGEFSIIKGFGNDLLAE